MARNKRNYKSENSGRRGRDIDRDNSKRNYSKEADSEQILHVGKSNDFSWYNHNPILIEDATKFSFFNQLGRPVKDTVGMLPVEGDTNDFRVPGICAIRTAPTIGFSETSNDPANIAAIGVYEYVRKTLNKPNTDYEAADMLIMLFCISDVYAQYNNIMRAFGIMGLWNMDSLYYPQAIMNAFYDMSKNDFKHTISNFANYKARFDQLIYRASFLFMPTDYALTQRHGWMYANIFKDGASRKAQLYGYRKDVNWKWNEDRYDTGSAAIHRNYYVTPGATGHVFDTLLNNFEEAIELLRNSSSVRIMQSDLRQAFKDSGSWHFADLQNGFIIEPVVSDEVLSQITNIEFMDVYDVGDSSTFSFEDLDVYQDVDTNTIQYHPHIDNDGSDGYYLAKSYLCDKVINLHNDSVDPAAISVATRGIITGELRPGEEGGPDSVVIHPASDICLGLKIITNPDTFDYTEYTYNKLIIDGDSPADRTLPETVSNLFAFDWFPNMWISLLVDPTNKTFITKPLIEWENYTTIDTKSIDRLHTACLISMWSIPQYGALDK